MDYAARRIHDFALVNQKRNSDGKEESIDILLESLGVSQEVKEKFSVWIRTFCGPDAESGNIWLGFLFGLYVHEFENE